jgi:hypothetical protein
LWRSLKHKTHLQFFSTLHHVHEWILETSMALDNACDQPSYQSDSEPIWKLLLLLETLLLHPVTGTEPTSADTTVVQRLHLFRQGQIQRLYHQSSSISALPDNSPVHFATDDEPCPSALSLANADNLRASYQRIQSTLPSAKITPEVKILCQNLYPSRIDSSNNIRTRSQSSTRPDKNHPEIPISENLIFETLSKLKPGTAGGPFTDLTDLLKAYALYRPSPQGDENPPRPYIRTFGQVLRLILTNNVPPAIIPFLSANRFIALHKDPDDASKLRPLGIGTAYRRIAGAYVMNKFAPRFSALLVQEGQFGVAIPGGINFLLHTSQAQLFQYIDRPLEAGTCPHRALLLLDIVNMFNEVSRDSARKALEQTNHFHALLPYFDLMYGAANRCYFTTPDGTTDFFLQHEGFPQGDPLATVLSCLVLHQLLLPLNSGLADRAAQRLRAKLPGDDGFGSHAATSSFIDDTFVFLDYQDLPWFLDTFQSLGLPLGIRLNRTKTKIFTTTASTDSADFLFPSQLSNLQKALSSLDGASSEVRQGVRFLGGPLGSPAFAKNFLHDAALTFSQRTRRLASRLDDKQTVAMLYKLCALPSLSHLLPADVLLNTDYSTPPCLTAWHSPLSQTIHEATDFILHHLSDSVAPLSPLSWLLAHHPVRQGGLGFRDHSEASITAFIVPLVRSLRYASRGIDFSRDPAKDLSRLKPVYARPLSSWSTTSRPSPLIKAFRHYLPLAITAHNNAFPEFKASSPKAFISSAILAGLQSKIYELHQSQAMIIAIDNATPAESSAFPSLLSPLTSIPLHSLPRRFSDNRFDNKLYTVLLQRKLRLPIFHQTPPLCRHCSRQCDQYGDHLFSCKYSKTPLHNAIRNTMYTLLATLAPLSGLVHNKFDILLEPTNLLPAHPLRRPADIAINLKSPTNSNSTLLALDVTVTPVPPHLPSQPQLTNPPNIPEAHLRSIKGKLSGRTHGNLSNQDVIAAINKENITLLPFTVDHLGGLGFFSHSLLFGKNPPFPQPMPPTFTADQFPHPEAFTAYQSLLNAPTAFLHNANKAWEESHYRRLRFGSTYHSSTPQQWALQCLALNLSNSLGNHLLRARAAIAAAARSSTKLSPTILGTTFYQSATYSPLVPGPPRLVPLSIS